MFGRFVIDVRAAEGFAAADVLAICVSSSGVSSTGLPPELDGPLRAYLDTRAAPKAGVIDRLALPGHLVLLAGVGAATSTELRAAGAAIARAGEKAVTVFAADPTPPALAALVEGLRLGGYRFHPTAVAEAPVTITIQGADPEVLARASIAAQATIWARELANTRASVKTPAWLAEQARTVLAPLGVQVSERDVPWLTEHGFGGVLAVGGGSAAPPRLIEAAWRPRATRTDQHIVLVGKSITFDTGGLNIKPGDSMTSMYTDMAAGAAVLAALRMVAELNAPIRVTALLPAAENSVSGSAMRTGDVIRQYGGRTSEVGNTDAEGRLVLADAMAYAAARLRPSVLVDVATLTGAMKVALGLRVGGLFATSDELASALIEAGEATGEPVWRLPLYDDYLPALASDIADANNSPGNPGGINAALFLRPFAAGLPWAHLDIAGPARVADDDAELSRGATGFGARLLGEWLLRLAGPASGQPPRTGRRSGARSHPS